MANFLASLVSMMYSSRYLGRLVCFDNISMVSLAISDAAQKAVIDSAQPIYKQFGTTIYSSGFSMVVKSM